MVVAADTFGPLTPDERSALAAHCLQEALYEHASVGAFARVALSLLAVGAPASLVADTQRAALDEVEHARAMFSLAGALRGEEIGPGPLDVRGAEPSNDLAAIAVEALHEGCLGECAASIVLREEAARARAPLAATLRRMAEDEERHAELAFRTLAWALRVGGARVRAAVEVERGVLLAQASGRRDEWVPDAPPDELPAVWILDGPARRELRAQAAREVVVPCLDALLAATVTAEPYA
jgi:hypothetical protein